MEAYAKTENSWTTWKSLSMYGSLPVLILHCTFIYWRCMKLLVLKGWDGPRGAKARQGVIWRVPSAAYSAPLHTVLSEDTSSIYSLYFSRYNDENWAARVHNTTSFTHKQMLVLKLDAEMLQSTCNTFSYQLLQKLNWHSFIIIHSVFCLTTGPKPPPKRCLHIVRSTASAFKWEYPHLSLRSSSTFLRLLPRLLATSISPFIFPSITCFRR